MSATLMEPKIPLPHSMDAEQALLGMFLVDNRHFERVADSLKPEHFYQPPHQRIFAAISTMVNRGQQATPVTLKPYFEDDEDLRSVGGARYLAHLQAETPMINSSADYARTIRDAALRRQIILAGQDLIEGAREFNIDRSVEALMEEVEARLFAVSDINVSGKEAVSLEGISGEALALIECAQNGRLPGVPSGLRDLDDHLGGFRPGELTIIGGRPGMGKTVLALTIALNAARGGNAVLFQSLEMQNAQLYMRLLARETGIPVGLQLRPGGLRPEGFQSLVNASGRLRDVPLYIDENGSLTAGQIRARARRWKRSRGLQLLVVDYLGLVKSADPRAQRVHQLGEVTKLLKATAKDLGIHVILLAQLSRGVEGRDDKRPSLADLRDSGEVEEDADVIMFPYREEYYLKEAPHRRTGETAEKHNDRVEEWQRRLDHARGRAEIIIGKFRQGNPGTVVLGFDGKRQCFTDFNEGERT